MATVYEINKGINRPLVFKGFKAQYITYLAIGLVALLVTFAILYVAGVNIYACLAIIFPLGGGLVSTVQRLSHKYGEHGMMKKIAHRKLPGYITSHSRQPFIHLKQQAK